MIPKLSSQPPSEEEQEQIDRLVGAAAAAHGHLCPGQVIGVRMAIEGLRALGFACPLSWPEIKQVVGFVEIDRCLADAVGTATGLKLGRGSLKFVNLGLLAASFLDLASGRAVRLVSLEKAREEAAQYGGHKNDPHAMQTEAYRVMPSDRLFSIESVKIDLAPLEMPGARPAKTPCEACGILVRGGKVHYEDGRALCAVCAGKAYFTPSEKEDAS